jgi:hypothetical protein
MATSEEKAHAQRLIEIHRRNLERLEEKKATFGIDVPQWVENQIDEERANIAALEPLVKVQPSQKVQEFVKSTASGEIDMTMLFMQGVQINARMTQAEQEAKEYRERQADQTTQIIAQQARDSLWRMQTKQVIDEVVAQVAASEKERQKNAPFMRRVLVISLVMSILSLMVSCSALILTRAG